MSGGLEPCLRCVMPHPSWLAHACSPLLSSYCSVHRPACLPDMVSGNRRSCGVWPAWNAPPMSSALICRLSFFLPLRSDEVAHVRSEYHKAREESMRLGAAAEKRAALGALRSLPLCIPPLLPGRARCLHSPPAGPRFAAIPKNLRCRALCCCCCGRVHPKLTARFYFSCSLLLWHPARRGTDPGPGSPERRAAGGGRRAASPAPAAGAAPSGAAAVRCCLAAAGWQALASLSAGWQHSGRQHSSAACLKGQAAVWFDSCLK